MKNYKTLLSKLILYLFIVTILPLGFLTEEVKADTGTKVENYKGEREIQNTSGVPLNNTYVEGFDKFNVLVGYKRLSYFMNDGTIKNSQYTGRFDYSSIKRMANGAYLSPYERNLKYKLLYIDLNTAQEREEEIAAPAGYTVNQCFLDSKSSKWVVAEKYDGVNREYVMLNNNVEKLKLKVACTDKLNTLENVYSFENVNYDKNNNPWFIQGSTINAKSLYKLMTVKDGNLVEAKNLGTTKVKIMKIASDGTIWIISDKQIIKFNSVGVLLSTYDLENYACDLTLDKNQKPWVVANDKVVTIENNTAVIKYTLKDYGSDISVLDDNNISVFSYNSIATIKNGKVDYIKENSILGFGTRIIKDSFGNVRMLSKNQGQIKISEREGTNKFNVVYSKPFILESPVKGATYYKDSAYFTCGQSIYKTGESGIEVYKADVTDDYNGLLGIEADGKGNLITYDQTYIYKVDLDKKVSKYNLLNLNLPGAVELKKDKVGNVYLVKGDQAKKAFKINDLTSLKESPLTKGKQDLDVFLNENDELCSGTYDSKASKYIVNKLDASDNVIAADEITMDSNITTLQVEELKKLNSGAYVLRTKDRISMKEKQDENFKALDIDYETASSTKMLLDSKGGAYLQIGDGYNIDYIKGTEVVEEKSVILPAKYDVYPNKEWIISINGDVDANTLAANIKVVDKDNNPFYVNLVKVAPGIVKVSPVGQYKLGEYYTITIEKNLRSQNGRTLLNKIKMNFSVIAG